MTIHPVFARLALLLAIAAVPFQSMAGKPNATELPPVYDGPTQIEFSTEEISKWTDLPIGTYRVPNSDVIISGHQKGGAAPILLFGLVGLAVQHGVNASNGKEAAIAAEQALTFLIDEQAKEKLNAALANSAYANKFTAETTPGRKFQITGAVVMSFADELEVLPYSSRRHAAPAPAWRRRGRCRPAGVVLRSAQSP